MLLRSSVKIHHSGRHRSGFLLHLLLSVLRQWWSETDWCSELPEVELVSEPLPFRLVQYPFVVIIFFSNWTGWVLGGVEASFLFCLRLENRISIIVIYLSALESLS